MSERGGRGKGRTGPVTAEAVVDAALMLIDEEGLDALTMRRLAHVLGVEPVTIYRQLPNKDAILAGVAEKLWREMGPPDGPGGAEPVPPQAGAADWRGQVRGMWLALNGLMQAHPNAIPIIARGGAYSATAGGGTTEMLGLFRDAGLSPQEAAELLHILSACVVGFGFATLWVRQIAAAQAGAKTDDNPEERPAAGGADATETTPAGEAVVPAADDLAEYVAATARWDPAQFAAALDIVLGAYGEDAGR
jgi:AcrR family transcriptional regulator